MEVKRTFAGKDYLLGKWICNLMMASNEHAIEYTETFSLRGNFEITLTYDNTKIKKLIKKAYKEMRKGNI